MATAREKFKGFYNQNDPLYGFTNFGEGTSFNDFGDRAQYSEIVFQAAKFCYLQDQTLAKALWTEYFATVKTPREAFEFMRQPRPELNMKSINDVLETNSKWHQPYVGNLANNTNGLVLNKDIEMAICLLSKFDPKNNPKLFQELIDAVDSPNTVLIETSPHDDYWGFAPNLKSNEPGKNRLGLMLTALGQAIDANPNFFQLNHDDKLKQLLFYYEKLTLKYDNFDFMTAPLENLKAAPKFKNGKRSSAHVSHSMFNHVKPRPDSKEVIKASDDLVDEIKTMARAFAADDFIIRKGNINGTFKVAFTNHAAATKFLQHLVDLERVLQCGLTDGLTYYGKNESHPMNEDGLVDSNGKYKNIVRFEMPEKALAYLQQLGIQDSDELFKAIMGDAPKLGKTT